MLARIFHYTAIAEGVSYILLLGIATPLKKWADWPWGVKALGLPHGILFIIYCLFLAWYFFREELSFGKSVWGFIASLLPFGTFFFDREIKQLPSYPRSRQD